MAGGWDRPQSKGVTRTSSTQWRRTRRAVLERDRHRCQARLEVCTIRATEVHHLVAHHRGGTDEPANLVSICTQCHRKLTSVEANKARWRGGTARRPADGRHPGIVDG